MNHRRLVACIATIMSALLSATTIASAANDSDGKNAPAKGAGTPQELIKKLAAAYAKADKEAFLACYHLPDELNRTLAEQDADKALAGVRLDMAIAKIDKRLGKDVFYFEKYKDRPTWYVWGESSSWVRHNWVVLYQPENCKVEVKGDTGTVSGTYRRTGKGVRSISKGGFKIARINGRWYVDKRPSPKSVLRRLPKARRDKFLAGFRDRIDQATVMVEAFEKEEPKIKQKSDITPALKVAVAAKEKLIAEQKARDAKNGGGKK